MFRPELVKQEPSKTGEIARSVSKAILLILLGLSQCGSGGRNATQEQVAATREPLQECFENDGIPCDPEEVQQLFPEE